jgi:hypothetical protein
MDAARIRQNLRSFARRVFTPRKVAAYAVAFALYVFAVVRDTWVTNVAWPVMQSWWRLLNQRPLGVFGWLFLLVVVSSLLWAALDPVRLWRERRQTESVDSIEKRIRQEVRNEMEVERARELLLGEPLALFEHAAELLRRIQRHLETKGHYGNEALLGNADRLTDAYAGCTKALNANSLSEVQSSLRNLYECVSPVIRDINRFRRAYPDLEESFLNAPGEIHTLARLKESHEKLLANTRLLANRSPYKGLSVKVREDFDNIGVGY